MQTFTAYRIFEENGKSQGRFVELGKINLSPFFVILLDYAQTLIEGEELMFIMDVPAVPAQETPIVLAQAAAPAGVAPPPDFLFNVCKETESTGDPSSAVRTVDPAGMLEVFLQAKEGRRIDSSAVRNIAILQDTTHGKITSVVDNTGRPWYAYDPTPDYIGNDRAVFLAEFEGKVYRIVVELHVFMTVGENAGATTCPEPQLIKVTKPAKPSSGANGYDLNSVSNNRGPRFPSRPLQSAPSLPRGQ